MSGAPRHCHGGTHTLPTPESGRRQLAEWKRLGKPCQRGPEVASSKVCSPKSREIRAPEKNKTRFKVKGFSFTLNPNVQTSTPIPTHTHVAHMCVAHMYADYLLITKNWPEQLFQGEEPECQGRRFSICGVCALLANSSVIQEWWQTSTILAFSIREWRIMNLRPQKGQNQIKKKGAVLWE